MKTAKNKWTGINKFLLNRISTDNKSRMKNTKKILYLFLTTCLLFGISSKTFAKSYSKTLTASTTVGSLNVVVQNTIIKDDHYTDDDQIILFTQTNFPTRSDLVTYVKYQYKIYVLLKSTTSSRSTYQIYDREILYLSHQIQSTFDYAYRDYAHYLTTFINGEKYVGTKIVFTSNINVTTRFSNGQIVTSSITSLEQ